MSEVLLTFFSSTPEQKLRLEEPYILEFFVNHLEDLSVSTQLETSGNVLGIETVVLPITSRTDLVMIPINIEPNPQE